jgi:hypothetical protein
MDDPFSGDFKRNYYLLDKQNCCIGHNFLIVGSMTRGRQH